MAGSEKIRWIDARFADPAMERDYLRHTRDRHLLLNIAGVSITIAFFFGYLFYDLLYFDEPGLAVTIRTGVSGVALALLATIRFRQSEIGYQNTFLVVGLLVSFGLCAIIGTHPNEYDKLYIALVQGAVIWGFVLRLNFPKMIVLLSGSLAMYAVAAWQMANHQEAALRFFTIFTVALICAFGVYLTQRLQRRDYLQQRIIDKQNEQLTAMLANVRDDNERKLAAMNMLVHFVRTPVHQIAGFTDVVVQSLRAQAAGDAGLGSCLESARYIKAASDDLTANVTKLLDYHRLDDVERANGEDLIDIRDDVRDMVEGLGFEVDLDDAGAPGRIVNNPEALSIAVKYLGAHLRSMSVSGRSIRMRFEAAANGGAEIVVVDDGAPLGVQQFETLIQPLTRIGGYLTSGGGAIDMELRTVARAVEICGGEISLEREGSDNLLRITIPTRAAESARPLDPDVAAA